MNNLEEKVEVQSAIITNILNFVDDSFVTTLVASSMFLGVATSELGLSPERSNPEENLRLSENGLRRLLLGVADSYGIEFTEKEAKSSLPVLHDLVAERMSNASA